MATKATSYYSLMIPVFETLQKLGGKATVKQINGEVLNKLSVSDELSEATNYNAEWARIYLKKYGIINNEKRGIWSINEGYVTADPSEIKQIILDKRR